MSADSASRFFLDTNVFVYSFDDTQDDKRTIAQDLISSALSRRAGVISFQVVQEFLNVARRRFRHPLSFSESKTYLERVLSPLCEIYPSVDLYHDALGLAERWKYSFYDSLILAAALRSDTPVLYSEDLQHGQTIEGLQILDPFESSQ